ncbi:tRNA 2-selenouridine(34) synthase MnmH [Pseudomonas fontis]|uniref:tRNA 2-selenouridine synthase n=1 Tax=Pseudomonas fontis TaxID=2942633 RepID=A0ABT5NL11_9PSED|nr:tRNA 2-selenouridine(34) synthase MnmH [Pseudomonas fontis]MDD0976638.1 tRNA 2-selenouridine(34) synthase MnmH [Pseudomonas fontis]MDD0988986.1 tRNA 2-selenouridine(34) synthase MnmH [Pseudomonas fontis]
MRSDCTDFRELFLNDLPLMDVRAPVEFDKGAFAQSINLPLMTDSERQQIGTTYKQQGQHAAIELGHALVGGAIKQARIEAWAQFARANPQGYLYCFRGGLRSQITQQWLKDEAGIAYPRVVGGYKALRTFLIDTNEQAMAECDVVLLGGMTGTGKTEALAQLDNAVDLEGHANHRGSSFGKQVTPQPPQISFENNLAVDFLKKRAQGIEQFVLEDEGRLIGGRSLPLSMQLRMKAAPLVWLEDSFDNRVERILKDYVVDLSARFVEANGTEEGFALFAERLRLSLSSIAKRLGGERFQRLAAAMDNALQAQEVRGAVDGHREWISVLLEEYYDPMYVYQRDAKAERIEFAGDQAEVLAYLRQRHHHRLA